jgi:hypothetical protein
MTCLVYVQSERSRCAVEASHAVQPSLWARIPGRAALDRRHLEEREKQIFSACEAAAKDSCRKHGRDFCTSAFQVLSEAHPVSDHETADR